MTTPIILASTSPRRREMLDMLGVKYTAVAPTFDENSVDIADPSELAATLSREKALSVQKSASSNAIIIASDTVVHCCDGQLPSPRSIEKIFPYGRQSHPAENNFIELGDSSLGCRRGENLGKPADNIDATRMLTMLSGNVHRVYSGITVLRGDKIITDCCCTEVHFHTIIPAEIAAYIATGEPHDKAGAYALQGIGGLFVERIVGDFNTVIGMPLARLHQILRDEFDYNILHEQTR